MAAYSSLSAQDLLQVHGGLNKKEQLEEVCHGYKVNRYYVNNKYEPVTLSDDERWTADPYDRTWQFLHHSLVSVAFLIDGYYLDNQEEKIETAFSIVSDWFEHNYPEGAAEISWHDHVTALRLLHITKLYVVVNEIEDERKQVYLAEIAEKHVSKLLDPAFYIPKHNHGLDQDITLYYAVSLIKELSEDSMDRAALALDRFWKQVDHLFGEDGAYLEHSPQYVYQLLDRLLNFHKVLAKTSNKNTERLYKKIMQAAAFFIYSLQPDGRIPTIGDSEQQLRQSISADWQQLPDELLQSLKSALKLSPEKSIDMPLDAYYPDGGYAFLRNDWENGKDTRQIIFHAAFHSRVHKHHDDLAFTMYAHGLPLVTDAGKYSYQYNKPERRYVISSYGHNTVRINNKETDLSRQNIGKSGLLSFLLTKNISYVSGMHGLIDGTVHRRILLYLKPDDVLVLDLIKGGSDTAGEVIFNIHPAVQVEVDQNGLTGYYQNKQVLSLENLIGSNDYALYNGEQEPLRGWYSPHYQVFQPASQAALVDKGSTIRFATHLSTGRSQQLKNFEWKEGVISFIYKSFHVQITLTDFYEHITINDKYFKTKKVFNKDKLLKAVVENSVASFQAKN